MIKTKAALSILLLILLADNSKAQGQQSSSNYIEPGYQITPLLNSAASFIEIEAGRQLPGGFSYGAIVHFLVSDVSQTSQSQFESVSSLWYVGTRMQYSSEINHGLSFYGGSTFGAGITNYRKDVFDLSTQGAALLGLRPEVGVRFTLTDLVRINAGVNLFYGYLLQSPKNFTGFPSLRVGVRLGK